MRFWLLMLLAMPALAIDENTVLQFSCTDNDEPDIDYAQVEVTRGSYKKTFNYSGGCPDTPTDATGSDTLPSGDYTAIVRVVDQWGNASDASTSINFTIVNTDAPTEQTLDMGLRQYRCVDSGESDIAYQLIETTCDAGFTDSQQVLGACTGSFVNLPNSDNWPRGDCTVTIQLVDTSSNTSSAGPTRTLTLEDETAPSTPGGFTGQ